MLSRRQLLLSATLGGAGLLFYRQLPNLKPTAVDVEETDAHFFIQLHFRGGIDQSYLFDARPLSMTKDGTIQNYTGEEARELIGINGQSTWTKSLIDPLKPHLADLSIINGVFMSSQFDGHIENNNIFFSGGVLGGEAFLPHLNYAEKSVLDCVIEGEFPHYYSNSRSTIHLSKESARSLIERSHLASAIDLETPLFRFMKSRFAANSTGTGAFSKTSKSLVDAMTGVPMFGKKVNNAQLGSETGFLPLVREFFKNGVAKSVIISPSADLIGNIDAHATTDAKEQPKRMMAVVKIVEEVLSFLKATQFDKKHSLFDVTTVMISSEMGRTMRQSGMPLSDTGTDHNPYSNTILLAGKGVLGRYILGESDFRTSGEKLSPAHLALDPLRLRTMGKPFDFKENLPILSQPNKYEQSDYIDIASVINTVMKIFKAPTEKYRKFENGAVAPILTKIIQG